MKTKRMAPSIRFKGFTDDWEQRKLKDIVNFSKGKWYSKGYINEEGTPIILYGSLYTDYKYNINDVKTFTDKKDNSVISKGSEVIIPSSGETSEDIARASAVTQENVILAGDLNVLEPNKDIDSIFLAMNLSNGNSKRQLIKRAQGKSVVHLYNSDIESVKLLMPTKEEQNHINELILDFDHTITLHQRKLQQLKEVKRGMLLKMFPTKKERTPSLRFLGYEGKWENKRIKDLILKGGSGGTPRSTNPEFYNGDIPFLSITDITSSNGYIVETEKKITKEGLENSSAWIVPSGSICLAMYASVGKLAIANIDLATSQAFYNMVFELDSIRDFSYQRLILANESGEWERLVSTGTQANLNAEKVRNFDFKISKEEGEIKEIGSLFSKLDRMIELQEREIELLEETKKGFLQKMFV